MTLTKRPLPSWQLLATGVGYKFKYTLKFIHLCVQGNTDNLYHSHLPHLLSKRNVLSWYLWNFSFRKGEGKNWSITWGHANDRIFVSNRWSNVKLYVNPGSKFKEDRCKTHLSLLCTTLELLRSVSVHILYFLRLFSPRPSQNCNRKILKAKHLPDKHALWRYGYIKQSYLSNSGSWSTSICSSTSFSSWKFCSSAATSTSAMFPCNVTSARLPRNPCAINCAIIFLLRRCHVIVYRDHRSQKQTEELKRLLLQ